MTQLETELAQRFCPDCPILRWRLEAAKRGQNLYMGHTWEGKQKTGYAIWMYPNGRKREPKDIVASAPTLGDICGCKA